MLRLKAADEMMWSATVIVQCARSPIIGLASRPSISWVKESSISLPCATDFWKTKLGVISSTFQSLTGNVSTCCFFHWKVDRWSFGAFATRMVRNSAPIRKSRARMLIRCKQKAEVSIRPENHWHLTLPLWERLVRKRLECGNAQLSWRNPSICGRSEI